MNKCEVTVRFIMPSSNLFLVTVWCSSAFQLITLNKRGNFEESL